MIGKSAPKCGFSVSKHFGCLANGKERVIDRSDSMMLPHFGNSQRICIL